MVLPLLQSTVDDINDYYENGDTPSCDVFESFNYQGYAIQEIALLISKEAAKEYAQWIYENLK